MRTITTLAGTPIELDGDALAVIETISRDLARRQELDYGFEDVDREIQHLIAQMQDDELRTYLKESLFMSFNRFENDRMLSIVNRANRAKSDDSREAKGPPRAEGKGQKAKVRAKGRAQRAKGKSKGRKSTGRTSRRTRTNRK